MAGKFVVKKGSTGKYRFNLLSTNGQVVASSEAYESKASAMNGIRAVKFLAADAVVEDQTGTGRVGAGAATKEAAVPGKVAGGACGYFSDVGLFGGPQERRGCGQTIPPGTPASSSPEATLPPDGSSIAVAATDESGVLAQYGPAIILGGKGSSLTNTGPPTGPVVVSTRGTRSVTSSASMKDVDAGVFTASSVRSTCTASKAGVKGSTAVSKGVVVTATDADGNPKTTKAVPAKPRANLKMSGKNSIGDKFRIVFNEQGKSRDGTLTVVAVHLYLLGPTAVGEVVIAESHCRA